ncbi:MAG: hypothetical protein KKE86_11845 [Planctomycetes bacterium]|nr:hypothetical protein [Planctomycetota bacterium]
MNTLAYKLNCAEVLDRLRPLYERRAGERIFAAMALPSDAERDAPRHPCLGCPTSPETRKGP